MPGPAPATGRATLNEPGGAWQPRVLCGGCGRPASVCLCQALSRVPTRTRVVILQHPREADVPIGTAKLAELSLVNVERHVGIEFASMQRIQELIANPGSPAILLYPGTGAKSLSEDPPPRPVTLFVLDGTWWQAQKLLKKNPELCRLPRYGLEPAHPSRYRIRREPEAHCVSTIEAIFYALAALGEDELELARLLRPFEAMVEHQLRFARDGGRRRHLLRQRVPRPPAPPAVLAERAGDLVLGYGETNAWPRGTPLGQGSELVHLAAERLGDGARFEAFIAPRRPLSPSFAHHTGLSPERVLAGESFESFRARWQAFLRPTDVLGAWGVFWTEALRREGATLPERLDLRVLARRLLGAKTGEVESCAEKLGQIPPEAFAPGRTGRMLSGLVAVVRGLRQRM